jgi:hypothetical protein
LTVVACNAGEEFRPGEKTARQPNQKTRTMTANFAKPRLKGIDTRRPVTEARDNPVYRAPDLHSLANAPPGARIAETATRVRIAFAAACPDADLFSGLVRSFQPAGP